MKNSKIILYIFLFISQFIFSQHNIQAVVFDSKNGLAIELGAVRLFKNSDSTLVQSCQTDLNGSFLLSKVKPGNYTMLITMVGYQSFRQKITMGSKDIILKNIQLIENSHLLGEVEIKGTAAQMVVKGDTSEFNATAFKTGQNAVVEDLLKRLPGVEVSSEGKITVHGQDIKKIRVNGKKFFNDDIEMATKNIPAELIDKIQVLDQKSDIALLTGFEDNDTERIINLTFKPNRKKGVFGNLTAGAGLDLNTAIRYDGNGILNFMDGDSQSTLTAGGNNTNTTRSSRGRGNNIANSGLTTTQNMGFNLNSLIDPKLKIGGDASINHTFNESVTASKRESYLADSSYFNNSSTRSYTDQYSGYLRLETEWKPDTLNTIIFQPNINYNRSFSDSKRDYSNFADTIQTSKGTTFNTGNGLNLNAGIGIIYSRKFKAKKGRTFTANLQTSISQNENESWNYTKNFVKSDSSIVDQYSKSHSSAYNLSLRISFVEPLWNLKNFLETSVSFKNSLNLSEKDQFNKDVYGSYSNLDSIYSNNFSNRYNSEILEMNYRYIDKILNIMIGMKAEPSQSYSMRNYENGNQSYVPREVLNFAPTARLQFNFSKKKFARIDYRGQTDQPSVSQLQPVKNNSNPMFITVGNPELKPAFNQSLRMMYTTFNDSTFSSFNASLWGQITKDAFVANSIFDSTGKQYSQTINSTELPVSVNCNIMYNKPLIKKRLHFNTNSSLGLDQRYGYSSRGLSTQTLKSDSIPLGKLSNTIRYSASESISLTYTNDLIEIGLRASIRLSETQNNLNTTAAITKDWSGGATFMFHLPYNINIGSDLNYTTMQGYSSSPQNQLIWNGTLDKSVFNGKAVIALKLIDILHQQLNIRQSIGDNFIQYNTYNSLPSYFLLSFSYKINDFKGMKNNVNMRPEYERYKSDGEHQHRNRDENNSFNR